MKHLIKLFFPVLLLLINSCNSPLSKSKISELSPIRAKIEMRQSLTDKNNNSATVELYDEDGYKIINKNIKIKVNDTILDFKQRQELYYTTTTKYTKDNIPAKNLFKFEIILTNGKSYLLGSIEPLAEINEDNIQFAPKGNWNEDAVIYWKNLKDVNKLTITKSILLNTSTKTEMNYDYEQLIEKKIENSGKQVVSKSNYIDKRSTISSLEIVFSASKNGTINTELLENSSIVIEGHIDKYIKFDEPKKE